MLSYIQFEVHKSQSQKLESPMIVENLVLITPPNHPMVEQIPVRGIPLISNLGSFYYPVKTKTLISGPNRDYAPEFPEAGSTRL